MRHRTIKSNAQRALIAAMLLFGPVAGPAMASTDAKPTMPAAYTGNLTFDILRNDTPVGSHSVTFAPDGDTVSVRTKSKIEIGFLFFTAYRFTYASESRWAGDRLVSLSARTDDDGTVTTVKATRDATGLRITGSGGDYAVTPPIYPTNHWHKGVIGSTKVLNTITGGIDAVRMVKKGRMKLDLPNGSLNAWHYAYTGDLRTEVWYDSLGRWVAMRFEARDGSTIRYVCKNCGQVPSLSTKQ